MYEDHYLNCVIYWRHCFVFIVCITASKAQQDWSQWRTDLGNFDNSVIVRTYYGDVKGYSIPFHIEDEYWNDEWDSVPRWYSRRVNTFLGIPYAEPPVGKYRFSYPRRPVWKINPALDESWDATYFRPACPQHIEVLWRDNPSLTKKNISEDCLYMNIFAPNITWHELDKLYPVQVFIHGGDWKYGGSQLYPGHVIATREIVVVTFNYRLGALGFLSTEDEHCSGNWGLLDQELALEFIKDNIKAFHGDPERITLVGEGTGAASVGLHLISPRTSPQKTKNYYHQVIMMSGSDLSKFGYVHPFWRPRDYAAQFARLLSCPADDTYRMMICLRDNATLPWSILIEAQDRIKPNDGPLGWVWGPVQDSGFYTTDPSYQPFLPWTPPDMRHEYLRRIPMIIGLNINDGVHRANESIPQLGAGLYKEIFKNFMMGVLMDWKVLSLHRERAWEAIEFQYTNWPDPSNSSGRAQEFINLVTDYEYGVGIDETAKQNSIEENTYFYSFEYKSWNDYLPHWMGVGESAILPYYLGVPFFNETVLNETEIVPRQWYDHEDRNMSDWVMSLWCNFSHYGNPTPNITNNITWEIFTDHNLTYLIIDEHAHLWYYYRQNKYGFWRDYLPRLAMQDYYIPTATPTAMGQEYKYALGGTTALLVVLLGIVGFCVYLLILQSQQEQADDAYATADLTMNLNRNQSQTTIVGDDAPSHSHYPYPGSYEYGGRDYSQDYTDRSFGASQSGRGYGSQYNQRSYGQDVSYSDQSYVSGSYNQSDV